VWQRIREDIQTIKERDPAAKNYVEILLCYPGLHAIWLHRLAHFFYRRNWFTTARLISHFNRSFTGIEIHPGAKVGRRLFIDHGMGVVIGETSEIGDDCLIYKGVVLGGTTLEKKKRHPTLGNRVIVGSNATILGAITIGDGARIGSGSVVVKSVPPNVTVVGVPARVTETMTPEKAELDFEHGNLPDPLADIMKMLLQLHTRLEERVKRLENPSTKNNSSQE
jgi:serine O-acetyltransferase